MGCADLGRLQALTARAVGPGQPQRGHRRGGQSVHWAGQAAQTSPSSAGLGSRWKGEGSTPLAGACLPPQAGHPFPPGPQTSSCSGTGSPDGKAACSSRTVRSALRTPVQARGQGAVLPAARLGMAMPVSCQIPQISRQRAPSWLRHALHLKILSTPLQLGCIPSCPLAVGHGRPPEVGQPHLSPCRCLLAPWDLGLATRVPGL